MANTGFVVAVALADGVGDALTLADGVGVGDGVGDADAVTVGVGDGVGDGDPAAALIVILPATKRKV